MVVKTNMELGNMIFGNSRGEAEFPRNYSQEFIRLFDAIVGKEADGYGVEFENDTFSTFPYYWGDCTCEYEALENAWSNDNGHKGDCFQNKWKAEEKRLKKLHKVGDEWVRRDREKIEKLMRKWGKANGGDPERGQWFCDCGYDKLWAEWSAEHGHDDKCLLVRPNFLYKPTGFQVNWYKYVGRDSYMTPEVSYEEFRKIMDACVVSLRPELETNFKLSKESWDELVSMLKKPARDLPRLRKLLNGDKE